MKAAHLATVFVAITVVSLAGLVKADRYYGQIYHGWDAQFYYSLSRSVVFDRDVDVTNDLTATPHPKPFDPTGDGSFSEVRSEADGRVRSKYPIGLSLVEVPLLAVGHLIRQGVEASGREVSGPPGYSAVEIWTVAVGLQLLFAAGLTALCGALAADYGRAGAVLGLLGCWLGTSLFFYSAVFPFMSHSTSFALLSLTLCAARGLSANARPNRQLAWLGLLVAAVFLVRPQQTLVAVFLLPAFASVVRTRPAAAWAAGAGAGAACVLAAVAAQVAFNHSQFGVLTLGGYSVGGEGFSWLSPRLDTVLVSPTRGLLVFSPVVVPAAVGGVLFRKSVPGWVWPSVANAVAQVYLIAAWSSPEQGDSFGARMWSDNAAVVAVGLAVAYHRLGTRWRVALGVATAAAVCWSMGLLAKYLGAFGGAV